MTEAYRLEIGQKYYSPAYDCRTITGMYNGEIHWINDTGLTGHCSHRSFVTWMRRLDYGGYDKTERESFNARSIQNSIQYLEGHIATWLNERKSDDLPMEYWLACEAIKHLQAIEKGETDYFDHRMPIAAENFLQMKSAALRGDLL